MACNLLVSSVHGISQARILEWVAIFSREFSRLGDQTQVSCIGRQILYHQATREARFEKNNNNELSEIPSFSAHIQSIKEKAMAPHSSPLDWKTPMDGGAWWTAVHGVAKSRTRLSDFTFTFHFHAVEKEMATHSSVLAWRIPGTGKPGGLSIGSHRHD